MRKVIWIDSMCHYLIQAQGKHLVLWEFPPRCCSIHDYEVNMDDAVVVTRWKRGRRVMLKFIPACLQEWANWPGANIATHKKLYPTSIDCGDNLKYL